MGETIARNKKAYHDYTILEKFEAGIVLKGSEVKSIREHKVNLRDSYGQIKKGELMLYNMHITPYSKSRVEDINPVRVRKLLMHRREIDRIAPLSFERPLELIW